MQLQCNSLKNQTLLTRYVCTMCINYYVKDPFSTTCNYNTTNWFSDVAIYLLLHHISKGIVA
jgi:hypothetical protein